MGQQLESQGWAAEIWDRDLSVVALTEDFVSTVTHGNDEVELGLGLSAPSEATLRVRESWPGGPTTDSVIELFRVAGAMFAADLEGGIEGLRASADARLLPALAGVAVTGDEPLVFTVALEARFGDSTVPVTSAYVRLRDSSGRPAGIVGIVRPGASTSVLSLLGVGDPRLFERIMALTRPARRPAAVLFADLEGSSALSRRLSSAEFFALVRRLSFRGDEAIVDAGGIVGKHVGDGVTGFFLAENSGSESAASRGAIEAARRIRDLAPTIAERSGLAAEDVTIRFGLHWGSGLYVGRLFTAGRIEATALGDEVNEAARIEACATGGRMLGSKPLLERLDHADAAALEISPVTLKYEQIADLESATDKARRDAPTLAVCEL